MAALDDVAADTAIDASKLEILRQAFWLFYHNNVNYKIRIKIWFISTSVSIEQLRPLFEMLFGPDPISGNG